MVAGVITQTPTRVASGGKVIWQGSASDLDIATGGGTDEEIAILDVRGMSEGSVRIKELLGEAGTGKLFASLKNLSDMSSPYVGDFSQIGEDIAFSGSDSFIRYFAGCYATLLIVFSKTGAGASADILDIETLTAEVS